MGIALCRRATWVAFTSLGAQIGPLLGDPRNYGFSKLTPLVKSLDRFEIDARKSADSNVKLIYIRNKD